VTAHWSDAYYGDLYLAGVVDLLGPRLSALEAEVIARLLRLGPRDRVLDLACGHGRHAWPLAGRVGALVGVERSGAYLRRATSRPAPTRSPCFVRGDLRALPLRDGSFDALYSWYASLFMFDDAANEAALAEAARVLRPGGRLLVHHGNPLGLEDGVPATARRDLPGGGLLEEVSTWDGAAGVDRCSRRLTRPGGPVLEGTAELRYYSPSEWASLAQRAGLRLEAITSTAPPHHGVLDHDAPDLIALLEKP
jgi:SAM-dependent methyltransferase